MGIPLRCGEYNGWRSKDQVSGVLFGAPPRARLSGLAPPATSGRLRRYGTSSDISGASALLLEHRADARRAVRNSTPEDCQTPADELCRSSPPRERPVLCRLFFRLLVPSAYTFTEVLSSIAISAFGTINTRAPPSPQISPTRWNRLNGQVEVCLFPC